MEERCRIADLRYKEVIDIATGERLGYANDVEINLTTGQLEAVVVPGALRFFGLFGREDDIVIPWEEIDRIGEDIILVRHHHRQMQDRKRERRNLRAM